MVASGQAMPSCSRSPCRMVTPASLRLSRHSGKLVYDLGPCGGAPAGLHLPWVWAPTLRCAVLCCVLQFMVNRYLALLRESDILNKLRCAAQQIHHSCTCKHLDGYRVESDTHCRSWG
jgi:hypothetical protein